jgi:hypothetical protein
MKQNNLRVVLMNNYEKIDTTSLLTQSGKYITNGQDNEYFYKIESYYVGSPTNQAVIDSYASYILGDGLVDTSYNPLMLDNIISDDDLKGAILDYKIHKACAFQVVYNQGKDKQVAKLYHIPTKCLAYDRNDDITQDPSGFWWSFDWKNKTRFKPRFVPAFGYGENKESEILYIKGQSTQPLFPLPDYQSGIQYCHLEEELSNFYINHIMNNFSAGKIVNINDGLAEDTDEAQEEAENAILRKLSGTSNAGKVIISFNKNKENATTVDNIEITDAYQQFQWLSGEASSKIMMAHKVTSPSLFGLPAPTGFSSGADEMDMALKLLYRSQINPMRKTLIKGLTEVFKTLKPDVKLEFKDFEDLKTDNTEE